MTIEKPYINHNKHCDFSFYTYNFDVIKQWRDEKMARSAHKESDIKIRLENLGTVNRNKVVICNGFGNSVALYFSYETIVAVDGVVSVNDWSKTTGKLLNDLEPDKSRRVQHSEVLEEAQKRINRVVYRKAIKEEAVVKISERKGV